MRGEEGKGEGRMIIKNNEGQGHESQHGGWRERGFVL